MNKREVGNVLEDYVVSKLLPLDKYAKRSSTSGAKGVKSDVVNKLFQVECKKRNTKDVTFKQDIWNKLASSLSIYSLKIPLYVLENNSGNRFAVLNLDDFFEIVYKANNVEEK
jgi:hypothetical protein